MTTRNLAVAVGVSAPFISHIEKGKRRLPRERRARFAEVLGLPADTLVDLETDTLLLVENYLRDAGGCDRAVRLVSELRKKGTGS